MDYRPREVERKWQSRWAETGRYEVDPDGDPEDATFVTVPYPYPSGGMHIGHARTYTVPDVYARYRRLQGDQVLFPIAWHVTGTPIVGAVERLRSGESQQVETLRDTFGVPESKLADLETPMGYARYFIENHYKRNMQSLGLSVDWRREFTTEDDRYAKFVTWQYETLRERGLLEQGLHPVNYCTNEEQPVTTHDLLEGEDAEFQEYTLVRFRERRDGGSAPGDDDGRVIPTATLRPETVRGATNAFVHPDAEYVSATVDGEPWIVAAEAVEKLRLQDREVTVEDRFDGAAVVGERARNPVTGESVLVLPATFVDPDDATGVVMAVPGHSPDDWLALREIKDRADALVDYGIDPDEVRAIEARSIIDVPGYGDLPAKEAVEEHGVTASTDPAVDEVTREVYNREFHEGELKAMYGEYAGDVVEDVRDSFRADHRERGDFDAMYEFTEDVVCRCGGDVAVAEQETWFLRYDDEDWTAAARRALDRAATVPESTRDQYEHTIDWLEQWPCIRNYGLGTELPWDPEYIIEPLSDSTIYMAYYTLAHRIAEVPVEDLDRAFFDALFYGPDAVEDPDERALALRAEFEHWYPVDWRCSGNDLINNHLTFYLYHHAELFDEPEWPRGMTVMGMGLLEGEAMSSSKGHVVLPTEAIEGYGADTVRFFLLNSAEPWQDYDWRSDAVESTRNQLERFWNEAQDLIDAGGVARGRAGAGTDENDRDLARIDRWLLSTLQETIRDVTAALDGFETRSASQEAFYRFAETLRWYRRRTDTDRPGAVWTRREVLHTRLRLLAPFVPFMANELHEQLTGEPAEDATWPEPDPDMEHPRIELTEDLVADLHEDILEVIDVTGTDPDEIRVYTPAPWKQRVFEVVAETGPDVGAAMSEAMDDEALRDRGDAVNELVTDLVDDVRERDADALEILLDVDETAVYEGAASFLEREFDAAVEVIPEADADDDRAAEAVPLRPAIYLD
ncbi:MAG: leucine--tRNA ligase [Halobacteriaceae archaeon]